ncbi:MAG: tRNA (adenosine(37)-N6)-threonylcarbamoyltransferase complex transferase subunit TsaD [Neisseriaceae bacterium]
MLVLGIETSCDETGIALYEVSTGTLLAHTLHSQVALHAQYGGVVPELASRDHVCHIVALVEESLLQAKCTLSQVGAIAYTQGPGLVGSLLVGAGFAHGLAWALNKPLLPVHHLEGHLLSVFLAEKKTTFPFIALLVSGGHTQFFKVQALGQYELLGESLDDAAGEAFDKTAKLLGLPYPGGAQLARLAEQGNEEAYNFPRPMLHSANIDMSFSGLKTAVFTQIKQLITSNQSELTFQQRCDLAASFQKAVVSVLYKKSQQALERTGLNSLVVAGGVGSNTALRKRLATLSAEVYFPELQWCTDNGAMIALAGALHLDNQTDVQRIKVKPRWPLADIN